MTMFEFFDYAGTFVFAISGALAAMNKRFDPFGVLILASVTAIGGGTLRDVLIGRTPVGWMQNMNYLYLIIVATVAAIYFRKKLSYVRKTLFLFDSIGLGLFTIIGVELGLQYQLHPIICILLGTMSAAFGGIIRDILANEIPVIFQSEIYASLSLLGGSIFWLLTKTDLNIDIAYLITGVSVVVLRLLAVKNHWELPKFYAEHVT